MKQILRTCTVRSIIFPLDLHGVFLCLITGTTFYFILQLISECSVSPFARLHILEGQVFHFCPLFCFAHRSMLTYLPYGGHYSYLSQTVLRYEVACWSLVLVSCFQVSALWGSCVLTRSYVGFQDYFMAGHFAFIIT